jgi:hypothetical protein
MWSLYFLRHILTGCHVYVLVEDISLEVLSLFFDSSSMSTVAWTYTMLCFKIFLFKHWSGFQKCIRLYAPCNKLICPNLSFICNMELTGMTAFVTWYSDWFGTRIYRTLNGTRDKSLKDQCSQSRSSLLYLITCSNTEHSSASVSNVSCPRWLVPFSWSWS